MMTGHRMSSDDGPRTCSDGFIAAAVQDEDVVEAVAPISVAYNSG